MNATDILDTAGTTKGTSATSEYTVLIVDSAGRLRAFRQPSYWPKVVRVAPLVAVPVLIWILTTALPNEQGDFGQLDKGTAVESFQVLTSTNTGATADIVRWAVHSDIEPAIIAAQRESAARRWEEQAELSGR